MVHAYLWMTLETVPQMSFLFFVDQTYGRCQSLYKVSIAKLHIWSWFLNIQSEFWILIIWMPPPSSSFVHFYFHYSNLQTEWSLCVYFISLIVLRQNTALHRSLDWFLWVTRTLIITVNTHNCLPAWSNLIPTPLTNLCDVSLWSLHVELRF